MRLPLSLMAFLLTGLASAQTPVEYFFAATQTTTGFVSMRAIDVIGTPHPEILLGRPNQTLTITNLWAPGGSATLTVATAGDPIGVVVADFNSDGAKDIAAMCDVPNSSQSTLTVLLASGGFFVRSDYNGVDVSIRPVAVDIDADGDKDIMCGGTVLLNDGNGGFPSTMTLPFSITATGATVGDFDGDGDLDIFGWSESLSASLVVQVLRRDGAGTYSQRPALTIAGLRGEFRVADMNADGRDDVVAEYVSSGKTRVRTYLGQTSASVAAQGPFELCGDFAFALDLELGDVDGDGDIDAVAAMTSVAACTQNGQAALVTLLANTGNGLFAPIPGYGFANCGTASHFSQFDLVDQNQDGDLDLVGHTATPSTGLTTFTSYNIILSIATLPSIPSLEFAGGVTNPLLPPFASLMPNQSVEVDFTMTMPNGNHGIGKIASVAYSGTSLPASFSAVNSVVDPFGGAGFTFFTGSTLGDITVTITTVEGASIQRTFIVGPTPLTSVSGDGQSGCVGTPFSQPLTVELLTSMGSPIVGASVTFSVDTSTNLVPVALAGSLATTDAAGRATVSVAALGAAGTARVVAAVNGQTTAFNLTVLPYLVATAVGGNNQTAYESTPFAVPLTIDVDLCGSVGAAGLPVLFAVTSPLGAVGNPIIATATVMTDANGRASTLVTAGSKAGIFEIRAFVGSIASVIFTLQVLPTYGISIVAGDDQSTNSGSEFAVPLIVEVVDTFGIPAPGISVAFSQTTGAAPVQFSSSSGTTDAQGRASIVVTTSIANAGVVVVRAGLTNGSSIDFSLFVRRLKPVLVPSSLLITYTHEHGGVPLILAADLPLPSPGYISTFLGDVHTSILSPGPNLAVLDGFGVFGSVDPGMTTSAGGLWSRVYSIPPVALGLTFVVEMYGYDLAYPGLSGYFISNPAYFQL